MMRRLVIGVLLLAMSASGLAQAADDPATAVNEFYGVYTRQHAQGLGIPDATVRLRFQPVLSPRLNKQLADAASAQARLTAKVKNAVPPVLEGDIFSSLFEGASAWKVGTCQTSAQTNAKTSHCSVALDYTPPPSAGAKAKPAHWTDTVLLVNTPQGWKVDDVVYDAGFAFGNTGRLSDMLAMVIASNP
jgi:hypothetical protein